MRGRPGQSENNLKTEAPAEGQSPPAGVFFGGAFHFIAEAAEPQKRLRRTFLGKMNGNTEKVNA